MTSKQSDLHTRETNFHFIKGWDCLMIGINLDKLHMLKINSSRPNEMMSAWWGFFVGFFFFNAYVLEPGFTHTH